MKLKLYLDVDGVILGKAKSTDHKIVLANHIKSILAYCIDSFDCYWLTTHCKNGQIGNVIKYLSDYSDSDTLEYFTKIKPTIWNTLKTEAIDLKSDFYWIDDAPLYKEKEILNKYGKANNLMQIDTRKNPDDLINTLKFLKENS